MVSGGLLADIRSRLEAAGRQIAELSEILAAERQAIHAFDNEQLVQLGERRERVLRDVAELERFIETEICASHQCASLGELLRAQPSGEAAELELMRAGIEQRLAKVRDDVMENRLRLLAAHDVVSSVLRHVGIVNERIEESYGPGGYR